MSGVTVGVFGSTGLAGCRVVSHALEEGHTVRAMARTPGKLVIEHPDLTVIEGDFENVAALQETVAGRRTSSAAEAGPTAKDTTRA